MLLNPNRYLTGVFFHERLAIDNVMSIPRLRGLDVIAVHAERRECHNPHNRRPCERQKTKNIIRTKALVRDGVQVPFRSGEAIRRDIRETLAREPPDTPDNACFAPLARRVLRCLHWNGRAKLESD